LQILSTLLFVSLKVLISLFDPELKVWCSNCSFGSFRCLPILGVKVVLEKAQGLSLFALCSTQFWAVFQGSAILGGHPHSQHRLVFLFLLSTRKILDYFWASKPHKRRLFVCQLFQEANFG
jgi:hypothetical protein